MGETLLQQALGSKGISVADQIAASFRDHIRGLDDAELVQSQVACATISNTAYEATGKAVLVGIQPSIATFMADAAVIALIEEMQRRDEARAEQ